MQVDQLFEVVDLDELLLEDLPLALDYGDHDVFINRTQKVLHLLPQELKLAQLFELFL